MINTEIKHAHLFCGIGGGAKGFNQGEARVGSLQAKFRCLGGIDVDAAAIRDFDRLVGVPGTVMDMFSLEQYLAFHGHMPPPGWKERMPHHIRRAFGNETPDIIFLSAPCKGFSGLLSEGKSKTDKYQALNGLTLRGVWLALEAYKDDPVPLFVFENVPRIATRGRKLLDQIIALFRSYGYAVAETTHDCGELGGLSQSRKRFLLVARHMGKVEPFLYEPEKKRLQSVGTLLDRMPLPGDLRAGPMHRIPNLQWKTWVRLAFVEAGSDWRSLNRLAIEDGNLRDYLIVPEYHHGFLGVRGWEETSGTVAGRSNPSNGTFSVADPRFQQSAQWNDGHAYGVLPMSETARTIGGQQTPGQGYYSVADPRTGEKHNNCFRVVRMDQNAGTVTGGTGPSAGGQAVADPRRNGPSFGKYAVTDYTDSSGTVIAGSTTGQGAFAVADPRPQQSGKLFTKYPVAGYGDHSRTVIGGDDCGAYAVADPRPNMDRQKGDHYLTGGHYGVVRYEDTSYAVAAAACHDNGHWSVADPRPMPAPNDKVVARILAEDGTWHRPFTTLELAALQSLVDPEEQLELDGLSDQAWRERIGNMVPPAAAKAIAGVMGTTLLLARSGETFMLSSMPIWVRPVAVALTVAQGGDQ